MEEYIEHPGVEKIKKMWERGDFETIDKMVAFWESMENLGRLGDILKRFIIWSGIIAGGYLTLNGYVIDFIRGVVRQ
jgi:hypothetical protein